MLAADDFEPGPNGRGIALTRPALGVFFRAFSARLQTRARHPAYKQATTYQRLLEVQARALVRHLQGASPTYEPLLVR